MTTEKEERVWNEEADATLPLDNGCEGVNPVVHIVVTATNANSREVTPNFILKHDAPP